MVELLLTTEKNTWLSLQGITKMGMTGKRNSQEYFTGTFQEQLMCLNTFCLLDSDGPTTWEEDIFFPN
jgi:hypothetical protein